MKHGGATGGDAPEEPETLAQSLGRAARAPRFSGLAFGILAASILLRALLIHHASWVPVSDSRDYHDFANNLAKGRGYHQTYRGETGAFDGFTFYAFRPPGYPALIATLQQLFGRDPRALFVANIAFDVVTQISFFLLALVLLGRPAALAVQILLGLHVLWTPNLMSESFFTALVALLLLLLVVEAPFTSLRNAFVFGILAAAAIFIRPMGICALIAAAHRSWSGGFTRRRLLCLAVVLAPTVLALTAWGIRNHRLLGRTVLLSTNLGPHNAEMAGIDMERFFLEHRRKGLNEAEINAAFLDAELAHARAHPLEVAALVARRAGQLFSLRPVFEIERILWKGTFRGSNGSERVERLHKALYSQYFLVYPLAAVGAVVALRQRIRLPGVWPFLGCYVVLHALVSEGSIRFAAPIYPCLCLLASVALLSRGGTRSLRSPTSSEGAKADHAPVAQRPCIFSTAAT